ncbi:2-oxoadipate dioxygenase/decarboxylase [Kineococcus glutinatus]|uniref:2-oxoadipate dioxygenase/decarboxylase n=1 Tax=Kineococcus glutinatus TaxID=1070872 RepID=A0ABP9H4V7_9ACTN
MTTTEKETEPGAVPGGAAVPRWALRAAFARSLSAMYGREVPAYTTLVQVATEVNADVLRSRGAAAERLGSAARVTAERHGAIRVGTREELRQVAAVFAGFGMHPVGFYDLRDASASSVPVVSTAFRPLEVEELARNPFRVFTSVLVADDRRFFDADLQTRLEAFLARRTLFPPRLLELAARAEAAGELPAGEAAEYLRLATAAFELSPEPVDRAWYAELSRVSAVAADIGGVASTHVNHLTPRVLDIDELYRRMSERGIEMIDEIQGPPRWDGPDVLLRQTSFRALSEPRRFREADGSVTTGALRVRFGEVEARGIALTAAGRAAHDEAVAEVDRRLAAEPGGVRADVAARVWAERLPRSEDELDRRGFGVFTYRLLPGARGAADPGASVHDLVRAGLVVRDPVVYEDFLPRSAAGIFRSNLTDEGTKDTALAGSARDEAWMAEVLQRPVTDPVAHCAQQRHASLRALAAQLRLDATTLDPTPSTERPQENPA